MGGLTSWQALKERAGLKLGQKVFIPAGAGGIGTFAIQLAKCLGAKVGATTSTENVDLARSLGTDEVIDYKKQQFENVLRGYDAVLGTVRGHAIEKSLRILKPGSRVVSLVGPPDAAFARARGVNFFMVFLFELLSRKISLSVHLVPATSGRLRQAIEVVVGTAFQTVETLAGNAWTADTICFSHPAPRGRTIHNTFFNTRPHFGNGFDGIILRAADLNAPISTGDGSSAAARQRGAKSRRRFSRARCRLCPAS